MSFLHVQTAAVSRRRAVNTALCFLLLMLVASCKQDKKLFSLLDPARTGIHFVNSIVDTDSLNILDYLYFYNGGGVAVGDLNNDGKDDIYFSSNQGSNKLYLNKGDLRFEDISSRAGVGGKGNWKTGVTMADINGDGLLDIYVCEVGKYKNLQGRNELFLNNGDLTFTESAAAYGLAIEGFNTQATFFDYDKDGDLDVFLVNHSVHSVTSYGKATQRSVPDSLSGDKLLRNDSTATGIRFTEVTREAGIFNSSMGYGLNVIVNDFNNDEWDDIYVSNDFHENDYYYVNNQDGTFSEMNTGAFGHESRFSMGSDAADINNDGWSDLITLDMLASDEAVLKSSGGDDPLDIYKYKLGFGYHHQFARNALQLNVNGGRNFSDIALYAGVAATDWSWSPLLADFDNDGIRDLFITNGIMRRPNDLDYIKFVSGKDVARVLEKERSADQLAIRKMPEGKVSNVIFRGTEELQFTDQTSSWGLDLPSLSNGSAYADLDQDGDLDLVVNNINGAAFLYENHAGARLKNHYINVELKGTAPNTFGFGARVMLRNNGKLQLGYVTATRGFESSSVPYLHFGTGADTLIDTLEILWPDHRSQLLTNVRTDRLLKFSQQDAKHSGSSLLPRADAAASRTLFTDITDSISLPFRHEENGFVDFNFQPFIPHQVSTQGPRLAVADINGDGLDDFYVCGAKYQPGELFRQTPEGKFISSSKACFAPDALCEDVDAVFFDADNDKDNDLFVVSGGNEFIGAHAPLLDRLYLNDGQGNFTKSSTLPPFYANKSVAAAGDFDRDGDSDIFVGGRVVAGHYGQMPASHILVNDGTGKFSIAPDQLLPGAKEMGMVTGAAWVDIDGDEWKELVLAGEWMPVKVFKNNNGSFVDISKRALPAALDGWYTCLKAADLDGDGDNDVLLGNWGLNSKLHASEQFPLRLYVGDIGNDGSTDQLLALEKHGKYYPFLGKEEMEKPLPLIFRKNYPDYHSIAGQSLEAIFGDTLTRMKRYEATTLSSMALINNGRGRFTALDFPGSAQWSPVFAFATGDFNGDGNTDIISAGNFYGVAPYEGRYDAGYGTVMLGRKDGFDVLSPLQSGFFVNGEVRDIKVIRTAGNKRIYAVARNNDSILFFSNR